MNICASSSWNRSIIFIQSLGMVTTNEDELALRMHEALIARLSASGLKGADAIEEITRIAA